MAKTTLDVTAKVKLDALDKRLRKLTRQVHKFETSQKKLKEQQSNTNKSTEKSAASLQKLSKNLKRVVGAGAIGGAIVGFKKLGDAVFAASDRLVKMQAVQANLPFSVNKAAKASLGFIDKMELMKAAATANRLGVARTSEEFAQLTESATKLGLSLGKDVQGSLDDLIIAYGRSSPKILDNLAIFVQQEVANRKYAESLGKTASELTDVERKTAFFLEGQRKAKEATKDINLAIDENAKTVLQTKVALKEFGDIMLTNFLPSMIRAVQSVKPLVDILSFGLVPLFESTAKQAIINATATEEYNRAQRQLTQVERDLESATDDQYLAQLKLKEEMIGLNLAFRNGEISSDLFKDSMQELTLQAENLHKAIETDVETVDRFGRELEELFKETNEKGAEALERQAKGLERELALLQARGVKKKEQFQLEQQINDKRKLAAELIDDQEKAAEAAHNKELARARRRKELADAGKERREKLKEETEKFEQEILKKAQERSERQVEFTRSTIEQRINLLQYEKDELEARQLSPHAKNAEIFAAREELIDFEQSIALSKEEEFEVDVERAQLEHDRKIAEINLDRALAEERKEMLAKEKELKDQALKEEQARWKQRTQFAQSLISADRAAMSSVRSLLNVTVFSEEEKAKAQKKGAKAVEEFNKKKRRAQAIATITSGVLAAAQGATEIASNIFPPNPAGIAGGAAQVTAGVAQTIVGGIELSKAGGGGGGRGSIPSAPRQGVTLRESEFHQEPLFQNQETPNRSDGSTKVGNQYVFNGPIEGDVSENFIKKLKKSERKLIEDGAIRN